MVFSCLWILLSDRLLAAIILDPNTLTQFQTYKGWMFVLGSSALIYFLLRQMLARQRMVENELRSNEERYRLLIQNSFDAILLTGTDGRIYTVNPSACRILGRSESEIIACGLAGLVAADETRLDQALHERALNGYFSGEINFAHQNGEIIPCEISTALYNDSRGNQRASLFLRDVSERKQAFKRIERLNRLYATLSQINQAIARTENQHELFAAVCQVVIEFGKFHMAWVGLIDVMDNRLKPTQFAGEEQGYLETLDIRLEQNELDCGLAGAAIREGRCVICKEIATDERIGPKREEALKRNYQSSAAVPIRINGKVIGALEVYSSEPFGIDAEDEDLLIEIGSDISFALDAYQAEALRRQSEVELLESAERFSKAFHSSLVGFIVMASEDGRIVDVNNKVEGITGFDRGEIIGRSLNELGIQISAASDQTLLQAMQKSQGSDFGFVFRTRDGEDRYLISSVEMIQLKGEPHFLASLIDITARKQAERQVNQLKRLYATLSQINQTIVRTKDRDELFQRICNVAVDFGEFNLVWIGKYYRESGILMPVASSGMELANLPFQEIDLFTAPYEVDILAEAVRAGKTVTSSDIQNDHRMAQWRDYALKHGFHSQAAVPFLKAGNVFGILNLYSSEVGFFNAYQEIRLLDEASMDIAFALDFLEYEEMRSQNEANIIFNEAFLRDAQRIARIGSWRYNFKEAALLCSKEVYRLMEVDEGPLLATLLGVFAEKVQREEWEGLKKTVIEAQARREGFAYQFHMRFETHRSKCLMGIGEPIFDDNGELTGYKGTLQDISDWMRH